MKESDTACKYAHNLDSAPNVQEMIHSDKIRLSRSKIICERLLPTFSDDCLSKKDVGCFGETSIKCPHPNSPHREFLRKKFS